MPLVLAGSQTIGSHHIFPTAQRPLMVTPTCTYKGPRETNKNKTSGERQVRSPVLHRRQSLAIEAMSAAGTPASTGGERSWDMLVSMQKRQVSASGRQPTPDRAAWEREPEAPNRS